jgi:hypothetical protein
MAPGCIVRVDDRENRSSLHERPFWAFVADAKIMV